MKEQPISLRPFVLRTLAYIGGLIVFAGFMIMMLAPQTRAASGVNRQINYQAKLLDSSGLPVADGSYSIKFSLYNALSGGSRVWTATGTTAIPTALTVTVQNGLFSLLLGDTAGSAGSQNALDDTIDWNSDSLYLGITIGSDSEMSPRKRLGAVPYALNAENLQGMYASSSVFGTSNLFTIHQASNTAATGTRTALQIKSKGTSNANDFIFRGLNDLDSVVLSVNRQGNVTSTGYLAVTGTGTSTFSGNISIVGNVSSTNLQVGSKDVCLADGTNCVSNGLDTNWTYDGTNDFARNATATTDVVLGSTATSTAPFFFALNGFSASSNRLIVGSTQNADVVIGSTTSSANIAGLGFQLTGQDIYAAGSIASNSGFYTVGSFLAGTPMASTTYGVEGIQGATNLTLNAASGFIRPSSDASSSLGSSVLRFDGYFRNVTSTNATTTNLTVTDIASMATTTIANGYFLINGTVGSTPVSGAGTRLMWVPNKGAFRAGQATGVEWNEGNLGSYSTAFGSAVTASGDYSFAAGQGSTASGENSIAIGWNNIASGQYGVSIGEQNNTSVTDGYAFGRANTVNTAGYAMALGFSNTVNGTGSDAAMALGTLNTVSARNAFGIGYGNTASAEGAFAIGQGHTASGDWSTAMNGQNLTVSGDYSFGINLDNTMRTLSQNNSMAIMGGNVGIGLVAPSTNLEVLGTVSSTNLVISGSITASGPPATSTISTNLASISASGTFDFADATIGGEGLPILVHRDGTSGTLNIHVCSDQNCDNASSSSTLADMSSSGAGPSVAIAPDGFPVIAYYDAGSIKYIHCLNYTCTSKEGPTTLSTLTASSTSIAIGVDGFPIIAYRSGGADALYVYHCMSLSCGDASSTETNVDTGGWYAKIAIRPNGLPVIAHYDETNAKFRMSACTNVACTADASVDISNVAAGSGYTSLVIGRDGIPTVLYFDGGAGANDGQLELMRCTDMSCTAFGSTYNVQTGMDDFAAGNAPWNDMVLGSDGFPVIAFEEDLNGGDVDPLIIHCKANDCSSVSTAINFEPASINDYSNGVALILRTDGVPQAFYHSNDLNTGMRGRSCAYNMCALDGKFSGSSIGSIGKYFYRIYGREVYAQQAYLSGFDLAESYPTNDATLQPGDVLAFDPINPGKVVRANASSTSILIGAVSTKPGLLLTAWSPEELTVPVALTGRVPVKVSVENGPIKIGDLLVLSSVPGVATKARGPGMVLGRALEETTGDALIEVFIQVGFDAGEVLAQGLLETEVRGNLALASQGTADTNSTQFDSWGLSFRGSAWDGTQTTTPVFTLKTSVVSATSSEFTIQNGTSTLFALDQNGGLRVAGDLSVGGKIYPANREGAQSETYLFVDDSQGPTSTYIATNAAGWQSDTSYDFAERYYSPDKLEPGDIVVVSQRENLHVQRAIVEKEMVAGIVSTKPGFVAGKPATSTYPIALIGRVPTKVSTMKGAIRPGDLLAPSTIPGVAMKAIEAGPVIGQALQGYDAPDVGKIEVFVQPLWWGGPEEDLKSEDEESKEGQVTSTTGMPELVTSYQGFALVEAGATKVHVSYPSLLAYPNVQATPRGEVEGGWWTDYYTDVGFDIIFKQPQTHDVTFAWRVEATDEDVRVYVSDGTNAKMDPTSGKVSHQPKPAPTSTQEIVEPNTLDGSESLEQEIVKEENTSPAAGLESGLKKEELSAPEPIPAILQKDEPTEVIQNTEASSTEALP